MSKGFPSCRGKSANSLNERRNRLSEAIQKATNPELAKQALDELINSATSGLDAFGEKSEIMQQVDGLIRTIEASRDNAQTQAKTEPAWRDRVNYWKAKGEIFRELRQRLLGEADKAKLSLVKLTKQRKLIEDMIAGENVEKAQKEMEGALDDLKAMGKALDDAVNDAQQQEKSVPVY